MILLLDIGNTRLKWARWDGQFRLGEALIHGDKPLELFTQNSWVGISTVWICAVPRLSDIPAWTTAVQQHCGQTPHFAQSQAGWQGLRSAYAQPEKLGVDRWLGMVALWHERQQPFCVVGAGTALTFDRVNAQGRHLGGLIAPGYGSMHAALLKITRTSTGAEAHHYGNQLGQDSESAIRQGAHFAAMGVIERALRVPGADAGERRILTGGDAAALQPYLEGQWEHRPHLVLEGLLALARQAV